MPDYEIVRSSADVSKKTISAKVATGVTVKCGHLISLDANGEWVLADQDGGEPADAVAFKDAAAGKRLTGCRWAELDCGAHGLEIGKTVQLSDTPGAFEISDGTGQIAGLVLSTTRIWLEPLLTYTVS